MTTSVLLLLLILTLHSTYCSTIDKSKEKGDLTVQKRSKCPECEMIMSKAIHYITKAAKSLMVYVGLGGSGGRQTTSTVTQMLAEPISFPIGRFVGFTILSVVLRTLLEPAMASILSIPIALGELLTGIVRGAARRTDKLRNIYNYIRPSYDAHQYGYSPSSMPLNRSGRSEYENEVMNFLLAALDEYRMYLDKSPH